MAQGNPSHTIDSALFSRGDNFCCILDAVGRQPLPANPLLETSEKDHPYTWFQDRSTWGRLQGTKQLISSTFWPATDVSRRKVDVLSQIKALAAMGIFALSFAYVQKRRHKKKRGATKKPPLFLRRSGLTRRQISRPNE